MNIRLKIAPNRLALSAAGTLRRNATGARSKWKVTSSFGHWARPVKSAMRVETVIPAIIEPLMRRISRRIMTRNPARPVTTIGVMGAAETSVTSFLWIMPRLTRPMKVMKKPMPTETAEINERGMASTIFCRIPTAVRRKKKRPDRNTTPSAVCQSSLSVRTSE
ncbi:MAG: hypothetical protein BWY49_00249 [Candidatus Omnitrophica bacterium ADurb.Bin314]|nr:MAG: hypothetical protein BWY49_00249 [Candidatus Omnitrophica bacterium ADurb.Bin314]